MDPDELRGHILNIRLTGSERAALEAVAGLAGLPVNVWASRVITAAINDRDFGGRSFRGGRATAVPREMDPRRETRDSLIVPRFTKREWLRLGVVARGLFLRPIDWGRYVLIGASEVDEVREAALAALVEKPVEKSET